MPFAATQMDLESIISEVNQKDRQIPHAIKNLKYDTRQTQRYRERICSCQGGRKDWKIGNSRFKQYSTQNYIQYPGNKP